MELLFHHHWEAVFDAAFKKLGDEALAQDISHKIFIFTYALPLHDYDGAVIWPARTFNPQVHDVWAVPQREIDNSSGVIKQNAGW